MMHLARLWTMLDSLLDLRRTAVTLAIVGAILVAGTGNATAQSSSSTTTGTASAGGVAGKMRINIFGTLGFGGEASGETEFFDDDGDEIGENDFNDVDLDTTNGMGVQFDYALHRYFLIGGRLGFNFIDFDDDDDFDFDDDFDDNDRSLLVNLDVVPKGRLPVAGAPIEFYLAMPLGPTFNFPNDDLEDDYPGDTDMHGGISWNLSLHAGLHYWFNSTIGVFVEQGWYHQSFLFHGDTDAPGPTVEFATNGYFNQFSVNFGLSIGL